MENKDENLEKLWEEFKLLKNKDQGKNTAERRQIISYEYTNVKDVSRMKEIAKELDNFRDDLTPEQRYEVDKILE